MKKLIVIMAVIVVLAAGTVAWANVANSKHNLSNSNPGIGAHTTDVNATVCGFCHIPHGGDISLSGGYARPLWARQSGLANYTVYGDLDANPGGNGKTLSNTTVEQPGANSITCLSCHDGTVALGIMYKNGVATSSYTMVTNVTNNKLDFGAFSGAYNPVIGGASGDDLTNDHPIGMVYPNAGGTQAGLVTLATAQTNGFRFYTYPSGRSNSMECGTCHDPHQTNNGFSPFLRVAASALCQGCHNK